MAASDVKIVLSAEDRTRGAIEGVIGRLGDVTSASALAGRALGAMGAAFSIGGLVAWSRATIDGIDALNDLKAATGSSIENISALEDVAKRTGTSFDTVGSALIKFNKVLLDAKPGSDAEAALKALNLDIEDLKSLDPAEALRKTSLAMAGFADDGAKGRLMLELFGKSTRDVAKFLQDLAEKETLVATVTTKTSAEAEKFNNHLSDLKKNSEDTARSLAQYLLPTINRIFDDFNSFNQKRIIASAAADVLKYNKELEALQTRKNSPFNFAGNLTQEIQIATEKLQAAKNLFNQLDEQGRRNALKNAPSADSSTPRPSVGDFSKTKRVATVKPIAIGTDTEELRIYAAALSQLGRIQSDTAAKTDNLSKTQQALREIVASPVWANYSRQQREQLGYAAALAQAEEDRGSALDAAVKSALARQEARAKESEGIREFLAAQEAAALAAARTAEDATAAAQAEFDAFGKTKSQLAEIALLRLQDQQAKLASGSLGYEALQRQIDAQKQLIGIMQKGELRDAALDAADKAEKAWRQTADSINASLTDALLRGFESGKDFGKNFADTLENMIKTAILRPLLAKVFDPISVAVSGGINSLLSFDGGGYTGSGLRAGGLDGKGGFLAMMHPNETVVDHTKGGSSGPQQTVQVVQNFTVGDVASVSLVRQAVANSERRIASSIGRSMAYGGALS